MSYTIQPVDCGIDLEAVNVKLNVSNYASSTSGLAKQISIFEESTDIDSVPVEELHKLIPVIFDKRRTLGEYLSHEIFLASNLTNMSMVFDRITKKTGVNIDFLQELNFQINDLREVVEEGLQNLHEKLEQNRHSMKLHILANVKQYKKLNNSRAMINGLITSRAHLQEFIRQMSTLDERILDINEMIQEINDDNNDNNDNDNDQQKTIEHMIYTINYGLDACTFPQFQIMIDGIFATFNEYINSYLNQNLEKDDLFAYEIVLLEDHLRCSL